MSYPTVSLLYISWTIWGRITKFYRHIHACLHYIWLAGIICVYVFIRTYSRSLTYASGCWGHPPAWLDSWSLEGPWNFTICCRSLSTGRCCRRRNRRLGRRFRLGKDWQLVALSVIYFPGGETCINISITGYSAFCRVVISCDNWMISNGLPRVS